MATQRNCMYLYAGVMVFDQFTQLIVPWAVQNCPGSQKSLSSIPSYQGYNLFYLPELKCLKIIPVEFWFLSLSVGRCKEFTISAFQTWMLMVAMNIPHHTHISTHSYNPHITVKKTGSAGLLVLLQSNQHKVHH